MDYNEDFLKLIAQKKEEEAFNIKEFLQKLLYYWFWFVLAGTLGLGIAYVYYKYIPPTYSAGSTILIKEKQSDGLNLNNMFNNFRFRSNIKLENHIGILTSFSLNRQVVENLGWNVSWYRKMPIWDYTLFGAEPFQIVTDSTDYYRTGIPLYIYPKDDKKYIIKIDAKINLNGEEVILDFEQEGEFGKKFRNNFFSFVLNKIRPTNSKTYYFVFNDLNRLALSYKGRIVINPVAKQADLISLRLEDKSSARAIRYLNELNNEYIKFGLKEKNLTSENTIRFIDQQLTDIIDTLEVTGNNLSSYRSKNKVFDLGQKASLVVEKLVQLDSKKSLAQMQLNYYENLNNYLDNAEKMKKMIAPSVVGITDATLNSLVVKLADLYGKKEMLSYSLQDKNPSIQMLDREMEFVKKGLSENINNLVYNTKQELKSIEQEIEDMNTVLGNYPKTEQDMINIRRMFDLNNELYTFLLQKRAEAEISKASNIADAKIIDPASSFSLVQTAPKRMLILMMGLFIGLAIPFLIIVIRDYFDETIHSKEEVQKLTNIPVVGNISHNSLDEEIPVTAHPRSVIAESLRELRTNLDYIHRNEGATIVGVHSVVPGEGKSFISLNLAAIITMNNKKVILIGGDMRKPTLHRRLNIKNKEGLSTYLIGHHTLEQIIKPTSVDNLDFIPSGIIPPNPAELLGTKEFEGLLDKLKSMYDVIIIDNSPATLVTDGIIVGQHTNIDLYVIRQNYSHKKLIDYINQVTDKNKQKKTGIVINDISANRYGYYSYRYGGYYRKAYGSGYGYYTDDKPRKHKKDTPSS